MRQQFGNVAPVPAETLGHPSPARSPPPPAPRDPSDGERDVFAKSDKWLPSLPTIDFVERSNFRGFEFLDVDGEAHELGWIGF